MRCSPARKKHLPLQIIPKATVRKKWHSCTGFFIYSMKLFTLSLLWAKRPQSNPSWANFELLELIVYVFIHLYLLIFDFRTALWVCSLVFHARQEYIVVCCTLLCGKNKQLPKARSQSKWFRDFAKLSEVFKFLMVREVPRKNFSSH